MSIHFICPHCAVATDVDEKCAGETGPCAHCGKAITIPMLGGATDPVSRSTIKTTTVIALVALALGAGVLAAVLLLTASSSPAAAARVRCVNNLKQIAVALQQYEAANGCFPPAFIPDQHGKPMHSWRVLLLPYLEQQDLYDRYRFSEPWNSPNNRAVTDLALGLYQCPGQPASRDPTTNYMMVVGTSTISSGRESRTIAEITDGLADTILLVEVADSGVWWAEPEDPHFDKLNFTINGSKRQGISSYHPHGVNVAFCDGSVRFLKDSTNPQLVKAMLTIDGGEPVPPRDD